MNEVPKELGDLLKQLSFTHERADFRGGKHWAVYAHPWEGEEQDLFDALISISPRTIEAGTAQGVRLALRSDNIVWLTDGVANQHGQVWFRQLPQDRRFNVYFKSIGESSQPSRKQVRVRGGSTEKSPISPPEPRQYRLPDRRIVALLDVSAGNRAVLTIQTSSPELAGVRVSFVIGLEQGEVTLEPGDKEGIWLARSDITQSLDVETDMPVFEIVYDTPEI